MRRHEPPCAGSAVCLAAVGEAVPKQNDEHMSAAPANFRDWSEQSTDFAQLAAVQDWDANLTGGGIVQHVEGFRVTSDFFSLLGMPMHLGRSISSADFQPG